MSIKAQDVNKLRMQTGAGIMDCKNALKESGGDFEKAIDILRKRGQKISEKRAEKEAQEGAVFVAIDESQRVGFILALSCETDFVAKNNAFKDLGKRIVKLACDKDVTSVEGLLKIESDGVAIKDLLHEIVSKVGEKVAITKLKKIESALVVSYVHAGNNLGVLVGFENIEDKEVVRKVGRDVAMQIAAMNPIALSRKEISASIIERELEIAKEQAEKQGKPEAVTQKIAEGKMNKFFQENTLLEQPYIKDPNYSVANYLKSISEKLSVSNYIRIAIK